MQPYTKIEFIEKNRLTATKYLNQLCSKDFLDKQKMGRSNYLLVSNRRKNNTKAFKY
ncbi:hypothetical protein [Endozoicomonas sp. 4G]|uniref:hypothetical protein n=1 Tax=Endozoicomonas sp. 4G TaxID=2872754 RepID=UPI003208FCDF